MFRHVLIGRPVVQEFGGLAGVPQAAGRLRNEHPLQGNLLFMIAVACCRATKGSVLDMTARSLQIPAQCRAAA